MVKNIVFLGNNNLFDVIRKNISKQYQIAEINKYRFSNDNFIYVLPKNIKNNSIIIIADFSNHVHRNLMGLFFCLDYFSNNNNSIENIIFTYFPYSRSNRIIEGQTSNLRTIVSFLNNYDIKNIITIDPHFGDQNINLNACLKIISQSNIFREEIEKFDPKTTLLIGPDKGSSKRINEISQISNIKFVVLDKIRNDHKEKVEISIKENDKNIIEQYNIYLIFDDEICSGNTINNTINKLVTLNPNCQIFIFITHAFLRKKPLFLKFKQVKQLLITDSISTHSKINDKKIIKKDVSNIILDCINSD